MARVKRCKPYRKRCRYCKTNRDVIPIVYVQKIDEELLQKEQEGELKIGAAFVGADLPMWYCKNCGNEFI